MLTLGDLLIHRETSLFLLKESTQAIGLTFSLNFQTLGCTKGTLLDMY